MQVHIVADFICPWCYVGKHQFERALEARPDVSAQVHWWPFQLNPDMPREGTTREEYLNRKFGTSDTGEMEARLKSFADAVDLDIEFGAIARVPNTLAAHTLAQWALTENRQNDVVEALFRANFVDGKDIGEIEVLCAIATDAGMDEAAVRGKLERGEDRATVAAQDNKLREMGIQGVPCTIIEPKIVVSGAAGVEAFTQALDQAVAAIDEDGDAG